MPYSGGLSTCRVYLDVDSDDAITCLLRVTAWGVAMRCLCVWCDGVGGVGVTLSWCRYTLRHCYLARLCVESELEWI